MNNWRNARNVTSVIIRIVIDKANSLGFTDISYTVTETVDNKYLLSIIFSYKGKQHGVAVAISAATLLLLEASEITPFVMQRVKDLLRHMYRVSGKNKEIPQSEEEYEQKYQLIYRNYDDKCCRGSFGCKNFASFLFNLIILQLNYDIVDVAIRK